MWKVSFIGEENCCWFWLWNFKTHLSHHFSIFIKGCWHMSFSCLIHDPLSQNEKSSACSVVRDLMPTGRSLMRMESRTGLKIIPWGMPLVGYLIYERGEPTRTYKLRLERKERMKENMFPFMPILRSLSSRALPSTNTRHEDKQRQTSQQKRVQTPPRSTLSVQLQVTTHHVLRWTRGAALQQATQKCDEQLLPVTAIITRKKHHSNHSEKLWAWKA